MAVVKAAADLVMKFRRPAMDELNTTERLVALASCLQRGQFEPTDYVYLMDAVIYINQLKRRQRQLKYRLEQAEKKLATQDQPQKDWVYGNDSA